MWILLRLKNKIRRALQKERYYPYHVVESMGRLQHEDRPEGWAQTLTIHEYRAQLRSYIEAIREPIFPPTKNLHKILPKIVMLHSLEDQENIIGPVYDELGIYHIYRIYSGLVEEP